MSKNIDNIQTKNCMVQKELSEGIIFYRAHYILLIVNGVLLHLTRKPSSPF